MIQVMQLSVRCDNQSHDLAVGLCDGPFVYIESTLWGPAL